MTIPRYRQLAAIFAVFSTLAACGGGGAGPIVTPAPITVPLRDPISQNSTALLAASLDTSARTTSVLSGTLNRAADMATIGSLSGAINADRSEVALTSGGKVTISPGANAYAARYVATPTTRNRTVGVVGIATPAAALPSGSATMTGPTTVTIQDGSTLYDLNGRASITANFATNRVNTTLSGLNGTRQAALSAPTSVAGIATVAITGSSIAANTFSGGAVSVVSTSLSPLGANPTVSVDGAFFGPKGQEVGGVVVIDDTTAGNLRIFADFIGK